jgi:hypothetical protein
MYYSCKYCSCFKYVSCDARLCDIQVYIFLYDFSSVNRWVPILTLMIGITRITGDTLINIAARMHIAVLIVCRSDMHSSCTVSYSSTERFDMCHASSLLSSCCHMTEYWHRFDDVLCGWIVGVCCALYAMRMITLLPHKLAVMGAKQQLQRLADSNHSSINTNSNINGNSNSRAPLHQRPQQPKAFSNGDSNGHALTAAERNL